MLRIDPAFQDSLNHTDFSTATASDFGAFFSSIQAGYPPLTIEYVRRHHVGFDAATVLGPIGARIDAGYDTQRVFFRRDLTGVTSPALQAVLSLEYQTGDTRKVILVEGSVVHLVDDVGSLLFYDRTTFEGTGLVRFPLLGSFDVEVRAVVSDQPRSVIVRPQIGWRANDHLAIHIGGMWLAGDEFSIGNYFERNSELYADAKYSL